MQSWAQCWCLITDLVFVGVVQGGILCGDPYFPTIFANLGDASVLEFALQKSGLMKGNAAFFLFLKAWVTQAILTGNISIKRHFPEIFFSPCE
jgi:hypothetical protein